jgi:hypothetical protein
MHRNAASSLRGTVEKSIPPVLPVAAEKVEISVQSGDDPSQRICITNTLIDAVGEAVVLKGGAAVRIVIRPKPKDAN